MISSSNSNKLGELARLFLKLGTVAFGGPAAHIAMMEDETVKRRQWLTREHFLDLIGASNLIPGPTSTQLVMHVGYMRSGFLGLVVAGASFIFPAALITGGFAWLYVKFGSLPQVASLLYGVKPVILAIILGAVWKLWKTAVKNRQLAIIGSAVGIALLGGANEVVALLLGGVLGMVWLKFSRPKPPPTIATPSVVEPPLAQSDSAPQPDGKKMPLLVPFSLGTIAANLSNPATQVPLWKLGLFFLKTGSVLFGGGYVLVAFIQGELVEQYGWLTQQQLLDAVAVGQFTPGPVLTTATFIGYVIAGVPGAVVATIAIFLPSLFFVAALNPLIPHLRRSPWTSAFLDAVNVSSVALISVAIFTLARATLTLQAAQDLVRSYPQALVIDVPALVIAGVSALLLLRFKVSTVWLVLGGAIVGWLYQFATSSLSS